METKSVWQRQKERNMDKISASPDSLFRLTLCKNVMSFHQTIDTNMKFRFSLIIADPKNWWKNITFSPNMRLKAESGRGVPSPFSQIWSIWAKSCPCVLRQIHLSTPFLVKMWCFFIKLLMLTGSISTVWTHLTPYVSLFFISVRFLCLHLLVLKSWQGFGLSYHSVSPFFWPSLSLFLCLYVSVYLYMYVVLGIIVFLFFPLSINISNYVSLHIPIYYSPLYSLSQISLFAVLSYFHLSILLSLTFPFPFHSFFYHPVTQHLKSFCFPVPHWLISLVLCLYPYLSFFHYSFALSPTIPKVLLFFQCICFFSRLSLSLSLPLNLTIGLLRLVNIRSDQYLAFLILPY